MINILSEIKIYFLNLLKWSSELNPYAAINSMRAGVRSALWALGTSTTVNAAEMGDMRIRNKMNRNEGYEISLLSF